MAGTTLFPAGAERGMTSIFTLTTRIDPLGRELSIDCPGVQIVPGEKNLVQISIAPTAPLGPHLIHVYNAEGASEPCWFSIGTLPEIREKEPNNDFGSEQLLDSLPVCINGQLEKRGDVDLFVFSLSEGQTLVAAVEAYAIGSAVDALLQLRDDQQTVLATAHDDRNLDPCSLSKPPGPVDTAWSWPGLPILPRQMSTSSAARPSPTGCTSPTTPRRCASSPQQSRVPPRILSTCWAPAVAKLRSMGPRLPAEPLIQTISPPGALFPIQVAVIDTVVQREVEPNNDLAQSMPLPVPACVAGRIEKAGDIDRFSFSAKKGDALTFRLLAKALGLPLDALIVVCDSQDKELARNDDVAEGEDPLLSWKAPADGIFQIKVSDLFNRGGAAAEYVLLIGAEQPTFSALITSKPPLIVEAGKTFELKATIKRSKGFTGDLVATVHGLPSGVIADPLPVPVKDGEFTITLKAAGNAVLSNGPVQLVISTKSDKDPIITHAAKIDLRGEIRRGTSLLDQMDYVWLTVQPNAPTAPGIDSARSYRRSSCGETIGSQIALGACPVRRCVQY